MATMTYTDISTLLVDIWEGALVVARDNNLMASLVRNFNGQGMQPRKSSIYGTLTFAAVAETDDVVAQEYSRSAKATLTPAEAAASAFISDQRVESDDQGIVGDTARELGGTLGVAIVGSLFASTYASKLGSLLAGSAVPAPAVAAAKESVGAGAEVARLAGVQAGPAAGKFVQDAVNTAFIDGFHLGCWVAAGVVLAGAFAAARWLPSRAAEVAEHTAHPDHAAEPALYMLD